MKNENGRQTMFIIPVKYSFTVRDGQASTLTSKKRRKKKTLHLVQSHCIWCACGCACECVGVCVHAHLSACVYELFVSPPQALGCWVCSLKRLCFCCHLFLPLSLFLTHIQILSISVVSLYHSPSPSICIPLSMLDHNWFQRTRQNVGGVSHSQPFTSSTGNDLMLLEREAG